MNEERRYRLRAKLNDEDKIAELLKKAESQTYLDGFDFSVLMHKYLISPTGYVMDTGNWENANREVALLLSQKIKKHPVLWKLFFYGSINPPPNERLSEGGLRNNAGSIRLGFTRN